MPRGSRCPTRRLRSWPAAPEAPTATRSRRSTSSPPRPGTRSRCRRCSSCSERGHDLGRLVLDLIEHLRQLMLAQHLGDVPEAAASSEEARERMLSQANQLGEATVLRLIDLLEVAVDDMRQG